MDILITQIFTPILQAICAIIGGLIVKEIIVLSPHVMIFIKAKIGEVNYNKIRNYGYDMFNKIEEDGRLNKLVGTKTDEFRGFIKTKFPDITDAEINLLRDSIAGEFNKDKDIVLTDPTLQSMVAPLQPIVKTVPLKVTTITNYTDPNTGEIISSKTSDTTNLDAITPSSVGTFTNGVADPLPNADAINLTDPAKLVSIDEVNAAANVAQTIN